MAGYGSHRVLLPVLTIGNRKAPILRARMNVAQQETLCNQLEDISEVDALGRVARLSADCRTKLRSCVDLSMTTLKFFGESKACGYLTLNVSSQNRHISTYPCFLESFRQLLTVHVCEHQHRHLACKSHNSTAQPDLFLNAPY